MKTTRTTRIIGWTTISMTTKRAPAAWIDTRVRGVIAVQVTFRPTEGLIPNDRGSNPALDILGSR